MCEIKLDTVSGSVNSEGILSSVTVKGKFSLYARLNVICQNYVFRPS
jgi:hypothetical protein